MAAGAIARERKRQSAEGSALVAVETGDGAAGGFGAGGSCAAQVLSPQAGAVVNVVTNKDRIAAVRRTAVPPSISCIMHAACCMLHAACTSPFWPFRHARKKRPDQVVPWRRAPAARRGVPGSQRAYLVLGGSFGLFIHWSSVHLILPPPPALRPYRTVFRPRIHGPQCDHGSNKMNPRYLCPQSKVKH